MTNDLQESTALLVKTEVERNVREELISTLKNVAQKKQNLISQLIPIIYWKQLRKPMNRIIIG
jgi:hypothetical protein